MCYRVGHARQRYVLRSCRRTSSFALVRDDRPRLERKLMQVQGAETRAQVEGLSVEDILYSLGTSHLGRIWLHIYILGPSRPCSAWTAA
jgi:hypothetical protein